MKLLALTIPGANGEPVEVIGPPGIPSGGFVDAQDITGNALGLFFAVGVVLALFYLIYGGIQWAMSTGDKQKVAAARNRIVYAIVGLVVIFFAVFLVNVILYIFNLEQI